MLCVSIKVQYYFCRYAILDVLLIFMSHNIVCNMYVRFYLENNLLSLCIP